MPDKEIKLTVKVDFNLQGALRGMGVFQQKAKDLNDAVEGVSQRSGLSIQSIEENLEGLMRTGYTVFNSMAQASPALSAQLDLMNFWFSEIFRTLGDALAPVFEVVIPLIQKMAEWFGNLPNPIKILIGSLALVGAGLTILIPIISTLTAVSSPWLLIIIAIIGAVILLAYAIKNNFGGIKDFFIKIWEQIKTAWDSLLPHIQALWESIQQLWVVVKPVVMKIWELWKMYMGARIALTIKQLQAFLTGMMNHIKLLVEFVTKLFKGDWKGAWQTFLNIFKNMFNLWKKVFANLWDSIKNFFSNLSKKFKEWGGTAIKNFFKGVWDGIKNWVSTTAKKIADAFAEFFQGHSPPRKGPFREIGEWGKSLGQAYLEGFAGVTDNINPKIYGGYGGAGGSTTNRTAHITNHIKIEAKIDSSLDIDNVTRQIAVKLNQLYETGGAW